MTILNLFDIWRPFAPTQGGPPPPSPLPSNFRADPFQATVVAVDDAASVDPFQATLIP